MPWFLSVLKRYATFTGRAGRREYWTYLLIYVLIYVALLLVDVITGTFNLETEIGLTSGVFLLATLVPSIAVAVRRLHDTDRSGAWLLLGFIPLVGDIVLLFFLIQEGDSGPNRYGAVPPGVP